MEVFDDSYTGIGVLTTTFTKIDIDDCVKDGVLTPFAKEIVNDVDSYTELSPSGMKITLEDIQEEIIKDGISETC